MTARKVGTLAAIRNAVLELVVHSNDLNRALAGRCRGANNRPSSFQPEGTPEFDAEDWKEVEDYATRSRDALNRVRQIARVRQGKTPN